MYAIDSLYRVQPDSVPQYSLEPRGTLDVNNIEQQCLRHLDWNDRSPSPFLSTFSDRTHAINWGNQHHPDGIIYEIKGLNLDVYRGGIAHEYLIAGRVDGRFIRRTTRVRDAYDELQASKYESVSSRQYCPGRAWHEGAGGYYSDEDEANEDNDMNEYVGYLNGW